MIVIQISNLILGGLRIYEITRRKDIYKDYLLCREPYKYYETEAVIVVITREIVRTHDYASTFSGGQTKK